MEKIAILDCGGQYTKVIDRKVRELLVNTDIFPIQVSPGELQDYTAIILSGGPDSVWQNNALKPAPEIFELGKPMLGICYGMQLMNQHYGGRISPHVKKEYGEAIINVDASCPLFHNLEKAQTVLMSHGDSIEVLAPGFSACAHSGTLTVGIYHPGLNAYGVQFHPEVDLSENGMKMLENFLRNIAGCKEEYSLEDRIESSIASIKNTVQKDPVIVLVSGGVDSAVTAALLARALPPEQITAIHIDHGLMRKNESDMICRQLKEQGLTNLIRINAKDQFYHRKIKINGKEAGPLCTVTDPEEKRRIIGQIFIEVVQEEMDKLQMDFSNAYLAQGTLRPDLIESGNPDVSGYAKTIKTHHNDVDMVRRAREKGRVIETNRDWHKDEVRKVAKLLGLSPDIAERQPFPGPGLGVRILCGDGSQAIPEELENNFKAVIQEAADINGALLPAQSVGVQGDCRTYGYLAMLAGNRDKFQWEEIYQLSKTVTNQISGINRLVYKLAGPDASGITAHPCYINDETVPLLQELDALITDTIPKKGIGQTFGVLLPIGITKPYTVVIRTFVTNDFMTGRPAFIGKELEKHSLFALADTIKDKFPQIEFVLYDITSKPPATCEWQ